MGNGETRMEPGLACAAAARETAEARRRLPTAILLLLLAAYGVGLFRDLSLPWIGMHDWNGAFYSQLARNLLRYPFEVHQGMPLVAVGADAPPHERSIYATHPAGLVWIIAAAFGVFGESEAVARLTAIAVSLASLGMMCVLVVRAYGRETALVCGFIYAVMPMAVFFGRMVNHEAYCLCAMLWALACWQRMVRPFGTIRSRAAATTGWIAATTVCIWVDWPGILFAGLFCLHAAVRWRQQRVSGAVVAAVWIGSGLATIGMLAHIVFGGLEGRWIDLWAIMTSRSGVLQEPGLAGNAWLHTVENLTLPVMAVCAVGVAVTLFRGRRGIRRDGAEPVGNGAAGPDGFWIITAAGIIWLLVFWRQYQIHNYWLFYLGPTIALYAARGVLALRDALARFGPLMSQGATAIVMMLVLLAGQRGVDAMFDARHYPMEGVEMWKQARRASTPEQVVRLGWDPIVEERFGGYVFRNITPPQMAYYLDRAVEAGRMPDEPVGGGRHRDEE